MRRPSTTEGFGAPTAPDAHHFCVVVPPAGPVEIVERYGTLTRDGRPEEVIRVVLSRAKWAAVAAPVAVVLNERLKVHKLAAGKWAPRDNKVERLLGKEVCVLAWAIEAADDALIPAALLNWAGLPPESRWWLFTMTAAATGGVDDGDIGWRRALRHALTENPTRETK